jgi:hypothetical protein
LPVRELLAERAEGRQCADHRHEETCCWFVEEEVEYKPKENESQTIIDKSLNPGRRES